MKLNTNTYTHTHTHTHTNTHHKAARVTWALSKPNL